MRVCMYLYGCMGVSLVNACAVRYYEFIILHWCSVNWNISQNRSHSDQLKQNVDFLKNGCNDSDYISPLFGDSIPKQMRIGVSSGIQPYACKGTKGKVSVASRPVLRVIRISPLLGKVNHV
jgi:hypothetical protein